MKDVETHQTDTQGFPNEEKDNKDYNSLRVLQKIRHSRHCSCACRCVSVSFRRASIWGEKFMQEMYISCLDLLEEYVGDVTYEILDALSWRHR